MQLLFSLPKSDAALVREVLAARYQRRAAAIARALGVPGEIHR
jgi:hypothetical protein